MDHSFFAMLGRMKYIGRWGLMHNTHPENLSEHTLEVAYLTHALVVIGTQRLGKALDSGQAVLYALYHDCSEILTGDLPTPVKYDNDTLKTAYKAVEAQAVRRLLEKLPREMAPAFAPQFDIPGEYAPVVKAADKLSALVKCIRERKAGNHEFDLAYETTLAALEEMDLAEAKIFIEEFLPAYSMALDEL